MTKSEHTSTRNDGSVDMFGALERGDTLRQRAVGLGIRRGFKTLLNALATIALHLGARKQT